MEMAIRNFCHKDSPKDSCMEKEQSRGALINQDHVQVKVLREQKTKQNKTVVEGQPVSSERMENIAHAEIKT